MSTFILIHGSWHGGWCWERVGRLLRAAGHVVLAPDLPGHGRERLPASARPQEQYVPFVCDLLDAQTRSVILVGHSSGGMIISAAAAARPDRVAALVYLAAFLLPPGVTPPAVMRDDDQSILAASLVVDRERQVVTVRPECAKAVFYADCSDADAAWATEMLVPEPLMPPMPPGDSPPSLPQSPPETDDHHIPRVYIETCEDNALGLATQRRMYAALPCERVYSLQTSHSPFLSAPDRLAACLLESAALYGASPL